jgi:tetratricopeptide (TPR) repeat protein
MKRTKAPHLESRGRLRLSTLVRALALLRCRQHLWIVILLTAAFALPARAADVAAYLERHGLNELLAVHLEMQIEEAAAGAAQGTPLGADRRDELFVRLSAVYATLLEGTQEPAHRIALEQRARRLLEEAPIEGAEELHLALLRGSFRTAERITENHRLRRATDDELARARMIFEDIVPRLKALERQLSRRRDAAMRRGGLESDPAGGGIFGGADRADRLSQQLGQCRFMAAWSLYYASWLNDGRTAEAREAERIFAELLLAPTPRPQPHDISRDLRSDEPFARAILGMALCKSITANSATALAWIELLMEEPTADAIRREAPVWRMAVHLEHSEHVQAREALVAALGRHEQVPLAWLRLAAVHGLEGAAQHVQAGRLARFAIAEMAARGEMQQVLDIAERYGVEAIGDNGFTVRYVRGLLAYRKATSGDPDDEGLLEAIAHFRGALAEWDVAEHPGAAAECRRLVAWSLYLQERYAEAHLEFEAAASHLSSADAAEALWMAIVCLDQLVRSGENAAGHAVRRASLIDRFLASHPDSERAPTLRLNRAVASAPGTLTPRKMSELLAIPPGHEAFIPARRRVAHEMYQRFRSAAPGSSERISVGREFLAVAVPLVAYAGAPGRESGPIQSDNGDVHPEESRRLLRRILEVALSEGIADIAAARSALGRFSDMINDDEALRSELDYRRVQERLLSEDMASAAVIGDMLWDRNSVSPWAALACRALFQAAHARGALAETGEPDLAALNIVARFGGRMLRTHEIEAEATDAGRGLAAAAQQLAVADALFMLWESGGAHSEDGQGRAALFLYRRVLDEQPRNARALRRAADLAEAFGEHEFAISCWRTLIAGDSPANESWYEARYRLLVLLARREPARALAVLEQHRRLHPEYGPEPWGLRLAALYRDLSSEIANETR